MFGDIDKEPEILSPWWRRGVILILIVEFILLIWVSTGPYLRKVGPPVPDRVVDSSGSQIFSGNDIRAGQQVFLKYAYPEKN